MMEMCPADGGENCTNLLKLNALFNLTFSKTAGQWKVGKNREPILVLISDINKIYFQSLIHQLKLLSSLKLYYHNKVITDSNKL